MSMTSKKIIMAAGGSGGHLFPAMAAARKLLDLRLEPVFIGVGLDQTPFFDRDQFTYFSILGCSINRKNWFKAPFLLMAGFFKSLLLIYHLKPKMIVGFGSYHSFPIQLAAYFFKIPAILFEPNLELGKVNAFFFRRCLSCLSYFSLNLPKSQQIHALKPLKKVERLLAKKTLQITSDKPVFLIMGGSQGSKVINEAVLTLDPWILKEFFVIHLAGNPIQAELIAIFYRQHQIESLVKPFSDQMEEILSLTDCMLARSGASTLLEAISYQIPTFFIPYGDDSKGHQYANATYFVEHLKGGAMMSQKDLKKENWKKAFTDFLNNKETFRSHLQANASGESKVDFSDVLMNFIK